MATGKAINVPFSICDFGSFNLNEVEIEDIKIQ